MAREDVITSDVPRVVVVGCGYWGQNLVRNLAELGSLRAVCDREFDRADHLATEYGVRPLPLAEALAAEDIDGVVVATPAETHSSIVAQALANDKHVFVEKPLALRVSEAEELIAAADEAERVLMVGHLLQYHPGFLELKKLVAEGELGRLQYIYSNRLNLGKFRREEDVFWSFAPHDISMILSLVDEEPDSVITTAANYLHNQVADVTTTHLAFPSGINAHIFVSWLHPFKEQKLVVVGDDGMAVFDDGRPWDEKLRKYAHEISWQNGLPKPVKAEPITVTLPVQEPLRLECQHFLDSIRNNSVPRTDGAEGLRVLRILEAAAAAAQRSANGRLGFSREETSTWGNEDRGAYFVHASSYVDDNVEIGTDTKIWHFSHILSGTVIGRNCVIGQNVMVGPDVRIGDDCKIQNNVSVYKGITLEDGVFCGPSCVFTNVLNPRAEVERKDEFRTTRVGRGATIGANATIVCGNDIGKCAFVAAGAVVTKAVPPYALVAGVPARRIGWMSPTGERLDENLVCPRTGRQFREESPDRLVEVADSSLELPRVDRTT